MKTKLIQQVRAECLGVRHPVYEPISVAYTKNVLELPYQDCIEHAVGVRIEYRCMAKSYDIDAPKEIVRAIADSVYGEIERELIPAMPYARNCAMLVPEDGDKLEKALKRVLAMVNPESPEPE